MSAAPYLSSVPDPSSPSSSSGIAGGGIGKTEEGVRGAEEGVVGGTEKGVEYSELPSAVSWFGHVPSGSSSNVVAQNLLHPSALYHSSSYPSYTSSSLLCNFALESLTSYPSLSPFAGEEEERRRLPGESEVKLKEEGEGGGGLFRDGRDPGDGHHQNHQQIMRDRDTNILNVKNNHINKNNINNNGTNNYRTKAQVSFTKEGRDWNAVYRLLLNEKNDQQVIDNYQTNRMGGDHQHDYHCSGEENSCQLYTSTFSPLTSMFRVDTSSSSVPPHFHSSPFSSDDERKSEPLGVTMRGKCQRRIFGFRSLGRFLASRREKEEEGEDDDVEEKEQREEMGGKRDDEGGETQGTASRARRSKTNLMSAEEPKTWNIQRGRKKISSMYSSCGCGDAGEVIKDCEGRRREESLGGEGGKWRKKERGNDDEEFERVDCRSLPFFSCWRPPSRIGRFPRIAEKYLCGERLYESTTSALLPKDADVLCEMDWLEVQKKKKSNVSAEDLQEWMKRILFISTLRRHSILANVLLAWRLVVDMTKMFRERLEDRRLLLPLDRGNDDAETEQMEEETTFQTFSHHHHHHHHLGRKKQQMGRKEVDPKILLEDKEEEEIVVMNISAQGHHESIHHCASSCGGSAQQAFCGCSTNCDSCNSGRNNSNSNSSSSSDGSSDSISNNCSSSRCSNNYSNSSESNSSSNCSSGSSSSSHRSSSSDSSICNCSSDNSSSSCSSNSSSSSDSSSTFLSGRIGSSFSCSSNSSANSSSCNANGGITTHSFSDSSNRSACRRSNGLSSYSCGSFRSNNSFCSDSSLSNNHSDTSCSIRSTSPSTCPATLSSINSISNSKSLNHNSEVAAKSRNTSSNGKESSSSSSYTTGVIRRNPSESSTTSDTINIISSVSGNTIGLTSTSLCCETSSYSHISIGGHSSGSPSKSSNSDDSNSKTHSRSNRYVVSSRKEVLFNKRSNNQRRRRTIKYYGDISCESKSENGTLNRKFRVSRSEADSGNRNNESNLSGSSSNSSISSNADSSSSSISSRRISSTPNNIISSTRNSSSFNSSSHRGSVGYSVSIDCCSERSKSLRRMERVMSKFCLRGSFSRWHLSVCVAKEVMREGARWKARVHSESTLRLSVEKKKRECEWRLKVIAAKMEGLTTLLEEAARMQQQVVDGEEAEFPEKGKRIGGHIGIGEKVYKERNPGKANANEENAGKRNEGENTDNAR